jgi:hypothetical protein
MQTADTLPLEVRDRFLRAVASRLHGPPSDRVVGHVCAEAAKLWLAEHDQTIRRRQEPEKAYSHNTSIWDDRTLEQLRRLRRELEETP